MSYLVIDLTVRKANMLQALGILSPVPVLPSVLAMHALDKKMDGGLGVRRVGIVHRHAEPWMESMDDKGADGKKTYMKRQLVQRRGAYLFDSEKNVQKTPLQPMALADLELTLLLDCDHDISEGALERVRERLRTMRLAGGVIEKPGARPFPTWDQALRNLRGRWIDDATALLAEPESHPNPIHGLLEATRNGKAKSAWLAPANLGYALLEDPEERTGARDGRPHAFAEDMIGLVGYTSMFHVRKDLKPDRLWRYGWDGDQFLVTNRPDSDIPLAMARAA